jgi:hypothetical protein
VKVLCVCNGGNVRSTALAEYLKGHHGHDAIAIGTFWSSPDTLRLLCEWADLICPVDTQHTDNLPVEDTKRWLNAPLWHYIHKIKVIPIGRDMWGNAQCEGIRNHVRACWTQAK